MKHGWARQSRFVASLIVRSEEHTSELQSLAYLVCRLLLEKKNRTGLARGRRLGLAGGRGAPGLRRARRAPDGRRAQGALVLGHHLTHRGGGSGSRDRVAAP